MIEQALELRHQIHRRPELSGEETETARTIAAFLEGHGLTPIREGLAGTGLLFHIKGDEEGPARLFRADLDALPLVEQGDVPHRSEVDARHHACGHDGHMAMLSGALAELVSSERLKGDLYGLFQPAEETGAGAAQVLDDPQFPDIAFDGVFSLHNLPGRPLGQVLVREGPMAVASVGLHYHFQGAASHAGAPHEGRNPMSAIAQLLLRAVDVPHRGEDFRRSALVTPIHVEAGRIAFGTSAGDGSVRFTVRADGQGLLGRLVTRIDDMAAQLAATDGLELSVEHVEPFPLTNNTAAAADAVIQAATDAGLDHHRMQGVMPWSEDFGHFTARFPGALACLGAGTDHPDLHTPTYDFPDELVPLGIRYWKALAEGGAKA